MPGRAIPRTCLMVACLAGATVSAMPPASGADVMRGYRSPVDVAVSTDERWLLTANARAGTVSLFDRNTGTVVDERLVGARPSAVAAVGSDAGGFLVSTLESGEIVTVDVVDRRLVERGRVRVGFEPAGVAAGPGGRFAFATLSAVGKLAVVDLEDTRLTTTIDVGGRPGSLAVAPGGELVAVACGNPSEIVLVDAASRRVRSRHAFKGFNVGQVAFAPDARAVYFVFAYDGGSHPSPGNIRRGWVTGSRVGRLLLERKTVDGDGSVEGTGAGDRPRPLEGLTLDVPGRAVGDVFGIAVADDGGSLLVTAGGTHELIRLSTEGLPWTQISGTEVMERTLARDPRRFHRLDLDGRPLGIAVSRDGRTAFVANALLDAVQEIDTGRARGEAGTAVVRAISVARSDATDEERLARRGEAIFHDARRSLDQWYSCHTCHHEGGGNSVTFDTLNDGSVGTYKTVLPLWGVARTGPWTWHGWQTDLQTSLRKSLVDSMQGPEPTDDDVAALEAFLRSLEPPPSPFREPDGGLSPAASRGRVVFASERAGCSACHAGDDFTTPDIYDVGLGRPADRYQGFNPPSLRGLHRKTMFLHNGRGKSLRDLLVGPHAPDKVSGLAPLSDAELADLIAYLESL